MRRHYEAVDEILLSIDGLQPEKGHETLDVVREWTPKRVGFAVPLISATADEVRRLIVPAKAWAASLGQPVALWLSDRQDAFVTGIAAEFPDVPHRDGDHPVLRDVAKPIREADSPAKVQMRKKVRGLRKLEQAVLKPPNAQASEHLGDEDSGTTAAVTRTNPPASPVDSVGTVVLDDCTAVGGLLNNDPGGPLHPPGLPMADARDEVRGSLPRSLDAKQGGSQSRHSADSPTASTVAGTKCGTNRKRSAKTSRTSKKSPRPSKRG